MAARRKSGRTGRPPKLTPEVQDLVCKAVAAGNTREDSARCAGVGTTTLKTWLARGQVEKSGIYRDFRSAVKKAESAAVLRNVDIIQKAAKKHWQAAAWWLERRRRKQFGRTDRHEHRIRGRLRHTIAAEDMTDEQLAAIAARGQAGTDSPGGGEGVAAPAAGTGDPA